MTQNLIELSREQNTNGYAQEEYSEDEDDDFFESASEPGDVVESTKSKDSLLISISPDQIPQVVKMEEENKALKRKLQLVQEKVAKLEEENRRLKRLKNVR